MSLSTGKSLREPTPVARWIRRLAIPIVLGWLLLYFGLFLPRAAP